MTKRKLSEPKPKANPTLFELKPNDCKWPVSSEGERGDIHRFCADPRQLGSPYCPKHAAAALPPKVARLLR